MENNKIKINITEDGSATLYTEQFGEHYHSTHGARQESQLIYLEYGLGERLKTLERDETCAVLEMGFGTGLNALMTLEVATREQRYIHYTTLEKYPIDLLLARGLNYAEDEEMQALFELMHSSPWNEDIKINEYFTLRKVFVTDNPRAVRRTGNVGGSGELLAHLAVGRTDVIYYDAFSPESQPELWEEVVFSELYALANLNAILTTYCAKGEVRRRMQRAGFVVERLAGPKGKREVLRAVRS